MSLVTRRAVTGQLKGERRSTRRGGSVEIADYRDYVPGDDPRYVDWNTYARLERLFLKLFVEEEDLHVYLLVDGSASMAFGEPPKFDYARRVAAALGYIGLTGHDRVGAAILNDGVAAELAPLRGQPQVFRLFAFLEGAAGGGGTALGPALRRWSLRHRRAGLAVLISDFFDPGWEEGLKALLARRFQPVLVQLLAPEEVEPPLTGDLKLLDSETAAEREVSITPALLREYRQALADFCGAIEAACRRYDALYLRATTDLPFEDLVLRWLRAAGLVR